MSRTLRILILLVLALVAVQTAVAEEPNPPQGARALFGQGNEEVFFPRQSGAGSTANMDPSNKVSEEMLTSFYKKPDFPGLAYSLELIRAGESNVTTVEDPRRHEFHTGDRMRIRLVPNFTGFAYVMEAKSSGSKLVYPANFGTAENQVTAGRETYVPNHGWLLLTEPAESFTMKVLFKPGQSDYRLNQKTQNPAATRVALSEAVDREWQSMNGSRALVFEADKSYVNTPAAAQSAPAPQTSGTAPAQRVQPQSVPAVNRADYTTNYVVVDPKRWENAAPESKEPAIAISVPIRHVRR